MKRGVKASVCVLGCLAASLAAKAVVDESGNGDTNPYNSIVERNVFDLKAPPPLIPTNDTPVLPPSNVKLTGITTILGNKRALFMVQEPALPGKPPNKPESVILTEGQRQGGLEVLEINPKESTVKINNDGEISVVTFDKTPLATPPAAGAATGGGAPRMPAFPRPNYPVANRGTLPLPARPVRTEAAQPAMTPTAQSPFANQSSPFANTAQAQVPQPQDQNQMTPEEQIIAMEIAREQTKDDVAAGLLPPLPPTALTEALQQPEPPSQPSSTPTPSPSPSNPALGSRSSGTFNLMPPPP